MLSDFTEHQILALLDYITHHFQYLVAAKSLSHHQYPAHHYTYSNWIDSNCIALNFELIHFKSDIFLSCEQHTNVYMISLACLILSLPLRSNSIVLTIVRL